METGQWRHGNRHTGGMGIDTRWHGNRHTDGMGIDTLVAWE